MPAPSLPTMLCVIAIAGQVTVAAPDCTITTNPTAWAGASGNMASVPDAGPGAAYIWQLSSGAISSGQGVAVMTFIAGAPGILTIDVSVTDSNGLVCANSVPVTVQASIILNEYNAVGNDYLEDNGEDTFWGRVIGNGGDWFEMVVVQDHLDLRNWQLGIHDASGPDIQLSLTTHDIWANLRSGTILTVSEELRNNADEYQPVLGHWWLNVKAADDTDGTYITASNIRVNNSNWQLTIRNPAGIIAFGPAGEGVSPSGGVGNQEVCKLEEDPSPAITPLSNYHAGDSSTFGSPNAWNGGASIQDFSVLRSVVPYAPLQDVHVNELLTHTDLPDVDWIELHNTSAQPVDIGRWYLSDDEDDLTQYQIPPGTIIAAGDYALFNQTQLGFALDSAHGEEVFLSAADSNGVMTGERDHAAFGAADHGISIGRYPNATGRFYALAYPTPLAANAPAIIGPIVINEIMYHPPDVGTPGMDDTDHEYIELHNVTGTTVGLSTYFPEANETDPWTLRGAVDFDFAPDTVVAPYGYLLVVSFDPSTDAPRLADFRATYGLDAATPIVGPYGGKLSNSGETLSLHRPDEPQPPGAPDEGFVPQLLVEEVPYSDNDPWPAAADGLGYSLERVLSDEVADLPGNWRASNLAGGTPGEVNTCPPPGDQDNNGVVDLADYQRAAACLSGPAQPYAAPRCTCFDIDADGDVDLMDVAAFTTVFTEQYR